MELSLIFQQIYSTKTICPSILLSSLISRFFCPPILQPQLKWISDRKLEKLASSTWSLYAIVVYELFMIFLDEKSELACELHGCTGPPALPGRILRTLAARLPDWDCRTDSLLLPARPSTSPPRAGCAPLPTPRARGPGGLEPVRPPSARCNLRLRRRYLRHHPRRPPTFGRG